MFHTDRKLDRRIQEIEAYRYRDIIHIAEFAVCEDEQGIVNPKVPDDTKDWEKMKTGDDWKGRDRYLWMQQTICIPKEWKGKRAVGIFDFGNTGVGNNSGFEAMCYLNGKPYQGVDVNHKEVFFPEELYGTQIQLAFRLWSGLEGGGKPRVQEHRIKRADLAWLDEKTDDLYYFGSMVLDTIAQMADGEPLKYELRCALDGPATVLTGHILETACFMRRCARRTIC